MPDPTKPLDPPEGVLDSYVGRAIAGRYAVVRKLNQGGMGAVYLAIQRPLDRPVAVKVLLKTHTGDPTAARRFEKEARSVSRLTHPHVVTLYDFGETEAGELYIAMEYLQGTSLRELLEKDRFLPWDRALHIMRGVVSALVAAHGAGIIHRDLKPENVMLVERSGDGDFPKVLDFGLAKSIEPEPTAAAITQRDIIPGTPAYLSPERANGVADDPRSDLYALGAMWFELLVGRAPFVGDSSIKVILRHIHEQPAVPSRANPQNPIPPAIDRLVLSLLEKHPDKRPQTAALLLERIEELHRPRGWHVDSTGAVGRRAGTDDEIHGFAEAAAELSEMDELSFSSLAEEPVPLVTRKSILPGIADDPGAFTTGMLPLSMPPPGTIPPVGTAAAPAEEPLLLVRKKTLPPTSVVLPGVGPGIVPGSVPGIGPGASPSVPPGAAPAPVPARPPAEVAASKAAEPSVAEPRVAPQQTPVPANLRIASLADVSTHLARARTAREVAELSCAFLATRFDRGAIVDLRDRGPLLLGATGFVDVAALPGSILRATGLQEMLGRKDAYYGPAPSTPDWLAFFRALGGHLPGAIFVATLKREGRPAFLFYGDHRDHGLRPDVRDTVSLLKEAATAFSTVSF